MNYYNEIKTKLLNNEIYKKSKDYSKNKSNLETYYNVGKLLSQIDKKYNERTLFRVKQFYELFKNKKVRNWRTN